MSWNPDEMSDFTQVSRNDRRSMGISLAYAIWRLDDHGWYSPTDIAARWGTDPTIARRMKSRFGGYKSRNAMTGNPETTNRRGESPGWFWKTLVADHASGYVNGAAAVRIALAPRLGAALMGLTRQVNPGSDVKLHGRGGLIAQIDRLPPAGLVSLLKDMERINSGWEVSDLAKTTADLSPAQLWEVVFALGLNSAQETWKARSVPNTGHPPVVERVADDVAAGLGDLAAGLRKHLDKGFSILRARVSGTVRSIADGTRRRTTAAAPATSGQVAGSPSTSGRTRGARFFAPKRLAIVFCFCATVMAAAVYTADYRIVKEILFIEGPVAAVQYTTGKVTKGDHRFRFQTAYALWRMKKTDITLRLLSEILLENPSDFTKASCNYILGLIAVERRHTHKGIGFFQTAKNHTSDKIFVERIEIEHARALTVLKLYQEARGKLAKLNTEELNKTALLDVLGRIEQETGNLTTALAHGQERLSILEKLGHSARTGYALKDIGFIQLALGNLTAAMDSTIKAQALSIKYSDHYLTHFLMVNLVAIRNCSTGDGSSSSLIEEIQEYSANNELPELLDYLDEGLELSCGPSA